MLRMLQRVGGSAVETIFQRENIPDGLSVRVTADWPAGRFTVTFTDTDAQRTIETRIFSNPESARWFANRLIPDIVGGTV